jgi:hypothetical protein
VKQKLPDCCAYHSRTDWKQSFIAMDFWESDINRHCLRQREYEKSSHVRQAIRLDEKYAKGTILISLGKKTRKLAERIAEA